MNWKPFNEQGEEVSNYADRLQAKVAELEAENARLKTESRDACLGLNDYYGRKLAAEQLNNKRLREALEAVIKVHGYESGIPVEAISTQASTEALDTYVDEKVKESHKVIPREGLVPHAYQLEATHNNAEYWYKWGHSEEMAAKGESVICMAQAVFAWRNAAYAKAEEVTTLTRQRDLVVEVLKTAYELATNHDDRLPFDWAVYCEMLWRAIKENEAK